MSNWLEGLAVVLGAAYLLLAIRERRSCWIAGGLASAIFTGIFWQAGLPMQAGLQVFYLAMAGVGWWHWGRSAANQTVPINRVTWRYHGLVFCCLATLTLVTLSLRDAVSDLQAAVDSVSSWAGVIATWMIAQKKLEAWLYWIVIDLLTAGLYLHSGLLASSILYGVYTVLAVIGWRQWRISFQSQYSR